LIAAAPEAEAILGRLAEIYDVFRAKAPVAAAMQKMQGIYHGSVLLFAGRKTPSICRSCHFWVYY
jgi:hypothetical protein